MEPRPFVQYAALGAGKTYLPIALLARLLRQGRA